MKNRIDRSFKRSIVAARLRYASHTSASETVDILDRPRRKQVVRIKRNDS